MGSGDCLLNSDEGRILLGVARETLALYVREGVRLDVSERASRPTLEVPRATFVTLRKDGMLRGCIGSTVHSAPLPESVRDNTIGSATTDPRFNAVTSDELEEISIEISVLGDGDEQATPFCRIQDASEIEVGRHGVYLAKPGGGGGLLLPQVAQERGWRAEQFLDALVKKAGLPESEWRDPDVQLYRFTAQIFAE